MLTNSLIKMNTLKFSLSACKFTPKKTLSSMNRLTHPLSHTDMLSRILTKIFTHKTQTFTHSNMPSNSLTFKGTYTLTSTLTHSILHINMLKNSLNHMTITTNTLVQAHKYIHSEVHNHTCTVTFSN